MPTANFSRYKNRTTSIRSLWFHQVCHTLGLSTRIVPHQLRNTFAPEMLRSGVSFPILMKLPGHVNPGMTRRYVDVAVTDLQREFQLGPLHAQASAPQPKTSSAPLRAGLDGLIDSLLATQQLMLLFRRSLLIRLHRLFNRLSKILTETRKLQTN